ncbi:hypothetical protein AAH978_10190 [Streptomyces sp. ZYX-F-203]|uniref:hypothetical protein n=1 Tax=Streptomyces sp. HSG2 TaxID=2797167 RepID=UPI001908732F|nr:hypothetical protein [Streptomyces sp. HSG2]
MHAYDAFHRQNGPSATPIYDALYAEYVKSFRSLPGDRSGEEQLGFTAFRSISPTTMDPYGARRDMLHVPAGLPPGPRRGA